MATPSEDRRPARTSEGLRIGTVLGAPVLLKPSWFLIAALVTYFYAPAVSSRAPGLGPGVYLVAFVAALLLLGSVFLHELAHAVAARSVGTPPTRVVLDLWGGHTAFEQEMSTPGRSALVSMVGPATNAALAGLGVLLMPAFGDGGIPRLLLDGAILANAFVAVFNALPGLPLDGGRALEALVWQVSGRRELGTAAAGWVGRLVALGLVVWFVVLPLTRGERFGLTTVIWVGLIAAMLWQGASQAITLAAWRGRSAGITAAALMRPAVAVRQGAGLADSLEAAAAAQVDEVVLLDAGGAPEGVLDAEAIAAVPSALLRATPASAVARAVPGHALIPDSMAADELIRHLQAHPHHEYVVLDAVRRVRGVLLWDDVVAGVTDLDGARDGRPPRRPPSRSSDGSTDGQSDARPV